MLSYILNGPWKTLWKLKETLQQKAHVNLLKRPVRIAGKSVCHHVWDKLPREIQQKTTNIPLNFCIHSGTRGCDLSYDCRCSTYGWTVFSNLAMKSSSAMSHSIPFTYSKANIFLIVVKKCTRNHMSLTDFHPLRGTLGVAGVILSLAVVLPRVLLPHPAEFLKGIVKSVLWQCTVGKM